MEFDRFVGIDWSGAKTEGQAGIRVAQINRQTERLELISGPNGRNWSRGEVFRFLESLTDRRTLVGLDFAFSVPWHHGEGVIPGCLRELEGVRDLWAFIDNFCEDALHFYGGPVWLSSESPFRPFIKLWTQGLRYDREVLQACLFRKTEKVAMESGLRPISVYRMAGPQVGAGSFAGMRALHAHASTQCSDIAIWPFDKIEKAKVVIVEVYPTLFYHDAGRRRPTKSQMRSGSYADVVNDVLRFYESPYQADLPNSIDALDALVSAAAIWSLAQQTDCLFVPRDTDVSTKEGWIFGVPVGGAA